MKQIGRSTRLVRVPRETVDVARGVAAHLPDGITMGHVLAEGLRLQGLLLELLHAAGHKTASLDAVSLLEDFAKVSEAAWKEGAALALKELENQTEERARVLATEALPHMVTSAVRQLFNEQGLPCPPISVGVDGSVELGDPPKGLGPIEA